MLRYASRGGLESQFRNHHNSQGFVFFYRNPYFLAHAAAARLSPDSIYRHYPNREIAYQQRSDDTPVAKRPLLSTLISLLAPSSSPGDLHGWP